MLRVMPSAIAVENIKAIDALKGELAHIPTPPESLLMDMEREFRADAVHYVVRLSGNEH